jgi:hypothetical protein
MKRDSFAREGGDRGDRVKDGSPLRGARLMDIPWLLKLKVLLCRAARTDVHKPTAVSLESCDEI